MEFESMANRAAEAPELVIDLDLEGLAALLVTIEEAMEKGRAQLPSGVSGLTARGDSVGLFPTVTVTFRQPRGGDRDDIPARTPAALLEPAH
jgi:hypothetical protein